MTFSSSAAAASLALLLASIATLSGAQRRPEAPVLKYELVRSYPHDTGAFTQGLVFLDGVLYEGTGRNGQSDIRKVRLENGEVLKVQKLENTYFGEGIAVVGNSIVQLTWQSGVGFVYDRDTFERTKTFTFTGEGWGLAYDGTRLIMSDGTATLRSLDPATLKEIGRLEVRDAGRPVDKLNELEIVKDAILANVWGTDRIARINPKTGTVTAWIDLSGLFPNRDPATTDVLNGIAYDAQNDRLFVTGKLWPRLFEIRVK